MGNGSGMVSCRSGRSRLVHALNRLCLFSFVLASLCTVARAEEPAEQYVQALTECGYFDVAIRYLDGAVSSDLVSDQFKQQIPYVKARLLIDSVAKVRDPQQQADRLDQADKLLTDYSSVVQDPMQASDVLKFQSNIRYLRGRNYLIQANAGRVGATRKKELFDLAKKMLGESIPKFREVQKAQGAQIEDYQIDPADPRSGERLRELQASYVDTRLKIPMVMEKFGLAFDSNNTQRTEKLVEAGDEFAAVAELYDQRFVQGQMARAFAARCFQKAGDYSRSAEELKTVFNYPNPPRALVREGLSVGVGTWPKLEPYPAKEIINAADLAVSLLNNRDKTDPTWLRIQLELARAKFEQSARIKTEDPAVAREMKRDASRLAREVARKRNPHSKLAGELLGNWGVSIESAGEEPEAVANTAPVRSFEEARQRAKDIIAPLSDQIREVVEGSRKLASMADAVARSDQQRTIDQLQAAVDRRADQALGILSQAVAMSNAETPRSDLNNVRYLQAYCHFAKQRYAEAAVIGRFLLEKYPTIEWSEQAAGLMVRSYERMFDGTTGPARKTAMKRVIEFATSMVEIWPTSNETAGAAISATRVAVIDEDFDSAKQFFDSIPSDSPTRGQLASRIGQQVWGTRKSAVDESEKLEITKRAKEFLSIAVENSDPAAMNFSEAVAALYHVDACRQSGDLDQAITRIEALLQFLDVNEAVSKSAKFRQSVYNASLNVFLDALQSKPSPQEWIEKSKVVIEKMGSEASGDAASLANVASVYRKVARDLKTQFESLPSLNEKEKFADSLKSFFAGIGSVAKDGKTRLWAGATLLEIAESLNLDGGTAKAKELSAIAIDSLKSAKQAGFGGDKSLELNYQRQLALAQRGSGDYKAAVESFEKILEQANGVNIQIDAAKTLFMWGVDDRDTKALTEAMNGRGEYRDPKSKKMRKRIWGWKLLASLTANKEKLIEPFRECEYYSVLCRLKYGEFKNNQKAINIAKKELEKALKRFPDLAVGPWKKKYEQLLLDLEAASKK